MALSRSYLIFILAIIGLFSCKKENEDYSTTPNHYPIIEIDTNLYSYIDIDTNYFYESNFNSIRDIKKFNIKLLEGRFYRFYASQALSNQSNITLSIVNYSGDTVSLSQMINGDNVLLFNANKDYDLILQIQLNNYENVSLDYRVFFEERQYTSFSHFNLDWQSYGRFDKTINAFNFIPSFSKRNRWLMLNKDFSNINAISFDIEQANNSSNNDFSFVFAIAEKMNRFDYNSETIVSDGIYSRIENAILNVWSDYGSINPLIQNQTINSWNTNNNSISVKIEKNPSVSGELQVYLNQVLSYTINTEFTGNYLYLYFEDSNPNAFSINNIELVNN